MALRTFTFLRPRFELAFMRVWFVAVSAIGKRQGLLEIAVHVALDAIDRGVLAEQRVLRLRVVKSEARQQLFPPGSRVAVFASLRLERSFVRIDVAVEAGLEFHVLVTGRPAGHIRLVAFLAFDLDVKTCQRIPGLGVVELFRRLPVRKIMTLQAVVSELALVNIFVAWHAILRQAEKGFRRILHLNERAFLGNHVAGHVTFFTSHNGVLSFQVVPRQPVIKLFFRGLPVDQIKVRAIVFEMAADALLPIRIPHLYLGVISVFCSNSLRYFFMAIQAFESRGASAELVTARALRGSSKRLMGFGEGARRDLSASKTRREKTGKNEKEKVPQPRRWKPYADVTSDIRLAEDQDVLRLSNLKQLLRAR
jgi:hypothetical protein